MIPHLYIHIPFCSAKCGYCAFYSEASAPTEIIEEYPLLLCREIGLRSAEGIAIIPRTIYMGGGTPSLLGADSFACLADLLKKGLEINLLEEWSVEMNPASVTRELLMAMRSAGVNRVTFGIQSFNDRILGEIGRQHDSLCAVAAIHEARNCGFDNIGLDLIAGLPSVTEREWTDDLRCAVALEPEHISVYTLSLEPGTPLALRVEEGLAVPDESMQMDLIATAEEFLARAGFERYEISNYARPGKQCLHNRRIWTGDDYLGAGPSASSRIGALRVENSADLSGWRLALRRGETPPVRTERLSPEDDAVQRTVFRLRMAEGISLDECARSYPVLAERMEEWNRVLLQMQRGRLTALSGGRWHLTPRGREVCDFVIRELL